MKITAFNPLIVSPNADKIIALFEELGFERRHTKDGINGDITSVDLKDADGNRVNIAQADVPHDMTGIRMNVDDFDEAYAFLISRGFTNTQGEKITDTGSSRVTMMVSPSGFGISLAQHIKKEDR